MKLQKMNGIAGFDSIQLIILILILLTILFVGTHKLFPKFSNTPPVAPKTHTLEQPSLLSEKSGLGEELYSVNIEM